MVRLAYPSPLPNATLLVTSGVCAVGLSGDAVVSQCQLCQCVRGFIRTVKAKEKRKNILIVERCSDYAVDAYIGV